MKFIELFAGIGGFRYGLEKANNKNRECWQEKQSSELRCSISKGNISNVKSRDESFNTNPIDFRCVYANEWDKYACQIYRKNFGEGELIEGDIREISAKSIPNHDLLVAGFPCQSFSIAGKRKGFGDTRGTLFFEICRIAEVKKPRLLLLENVKGLLNHENGETFRIILNSLSELGYDCEWEVLNSKNFGVPQNRERVFIIGHFRGKGGQKVFPIGEGNETNNDKGEELPEQISNTLRTNYSSGFSNETYVGALDSNYYKGDNRPNNKSNRPRVYQDMKIRRLTPTECERLQGFPDGWTEGISDTQRYKCLGNAVTTNVITEIGRKIL